MKIDYAIVSSDTDPYYLEFWPIVSRIWKVKFNITPVLFLVHDNPSVRVTEEYGKVVYFKPVDGVPIHIQAQCSRYWYPQFEPDATWITSDIDMLPISKRYFIDSIRDIPNDKFVNMNARQVALFPCCYNVATGKTFKEVLGLTDDYSQYLRETNWLDIKYDHTPQNRGVLMRFWGADEAHCNRKVREFPDQSKFVLTKRHDRPPRDTCPLRVDRQYWDRWNPSQVESEFYIDAHLPRPYSKFKPEIDRLVSLIMKGH
jgi:hypothetical protein